MGEAVEEGAAVGFGLVAVSVGRRHRRLLGDEVFLGFKAALGQVAGARREWERGSGGVG
ncbi:hypothetical protein [Actinomadura sp. NTSP31]|uniref:hypothetical protein n=1 Tax=Actinomadura sp. NTSP31 TaxID=1735447 RepID=UPI0035C00B7A